MKYLLALISLVALIPVLHADDKVPEDKIPKYQKTDTYVASPTMLVRAGIDGEIKEIWSGMDATRMRHQPLLLETSVYGEIRKGDEWTDLRGLKYHYDGTRPGYILMKSDNGLLSIEISSIKHAEAAPIFVKYTFSGPVDFRLSARFYRPELTQEAHADDNTGIAAFSTLWRNLEDTALARDTSPRLILATQPLGKTLSIDKTGLVKEIESTKEILLCIDATGTAVEANASRSYVAWWVSRLAGLKDSDAEIASRLVSLTSDDKKLDRLFEASIDAVESLQFASGVITADIFGYQNSWLRDGTYSMIGLALAGDESDVGRYFAFWNAECDLCAGRKRRDPGLWDQYDFSVGGEIEAQQPAIAITGMWYYSRLIPDGPAFLDKVWNYVQYFGDYYTRRVDGEGMVSAADEWICEIPAPDSWPNAEIYSGLRAAAKMADELGKTQQAQEWNRAAEKLQERFSIQTYDKDKGRIIPHAGPAGESYRSVDHPKRVGENGPLRDDRVDAGMLNTARLEAFGTGQGIVSADDSKFASTQAQIIRDLENSDHTIRSWGPNPASPHSPLGGNAFSTAALWAAQDEWLLGRTDLAWRYLLSGIVNKQGYNLAAANYYIPESWDKQGVPGDPLLVWSHGEFIHSVMLLFLGIDLEPQGADLGLAPSLPPGMNHARIDNFSFRNWRLTIDLNRRNGFVDVAVAARNQHAAGRKLAIRIPSGKVIEVKAGHEARFTVDPAQYYALFGRSRNAAERLSIFSKILTGKAPATDPAQMKPSELEEDILNLETSHLPEAK